MHPVFILRQITSSFKQTGVFVACVALSLVTLVSLGGFGESVNNALLRDARKLLAGDIVVESTFPFDESLQAELEALENRPGSRVARTYAFLTLVRPADGGDSLLTELKVVEPGYPFYGEVLLASGGSFAEALVPGRAIVAQNLLDRMGLQIGDKLQVGETRVTIADVVLGEPDRPVDFFAFGPRVFLAAADLEATGLVRLGSRVRYRTLVQVDDESVLDSIAENLRLAADPGLVDVDTFRTNQSGVESFFENLLTFLNLIGIFTLLLAGIGIQSSLGAFIREREETVAILRTVGAKSGFIMRQFFGVAAVLGAVGTLIGIALGISLQWLFPLLFGPFLPPQVEFILSGSAILEGLVLGFFVVGIFTFLPIYRLQGMKPRFIFRKEPAAGGRDAVFFFSQALILAFIVTMTFRYLQDPLQTFYFAAGTVLLVLIIAGLARLILGWLRKRSVQRLDVRQALRGLFRPRAATAGILVTLAASLSVLFTLYLIERNLDASFVSAYPADSPNIFLIDIQPDQRKGLEELVGEEVEFIPLVQTRIVEINGETVEPLDGQDGPPDGPPRPGEPVSVTYRGTLPENEFLVEGDGLFSDEAAGQAQVSISRETHEAFSIAVGDRLVFDIQGVQLAAEVVSVRGVRETGEGFAGPSFSYLFREQDLAGAPQSIVTAVTVAADNVPKFQNDVVARFPNITVIDISATLQTLAGIVGDITTIIRFFTAFSIVAGVLIIISSVLATRFARIQESVYFKVLGAKRSFVLRVFALENLFIGLVSAFLALFLSQVAGWLLVTQVFELSYEAYVGSSILLMIFTVTLVGVVGLLASVSILKKKPIAFLRENSVE